jgi:DNA anti-recombination protein RmuC
MYRMRESWTDERLDDFAKHVDQLFDAVDQRFDRVDQRFDAVDQRFDRVEADLRTMQMEMNRRFDALQRQMLQSSVAIVVALIGLIATQL